MNRYTMADQPADQTLMNDYIFSLLVHLKNANFYHINKSAVILFHCFKNKQKQHTKNKKQHKKTKQNQRVSICRKNKLVLLSEDKI